MKGTESTRTRRWRTLLLIGALAGLCFSVGEGLRLTPLPAPTTAEAARPEAGGVSAGRAEAAPDRYGPLDKPSRSQVGKRGKRHAPDFACPPSRITGEPSDDPPRATCPDAAAGHARTPSLSHPAGRAPPREV